MAFIPNIQGIRITGSLTGITSINVTGNTSLQALTATTISATTYQNLPIDIRVTGATYANNTFIYTNNTGGTFSVLFNTVTGLTVNGNLTSNNISATTLSGSGIGLTNIPIAGITNLQSELDNKFDKSGGTVTGNVLVTGNVTILGTATTINTDTLSVKDSLITLNSNATGNTLPFPINSGIEILRNSATTASLLWEELNGYWTAGLTGDTRRIIVSGDSLSLLNSGHTHPISEIINLQSSLDDKFDKSGGVISGGLTANTISATTYQNLPVSGLTGGENISITGLNGNYTVSFTGTTGSNFTGGTVTGETIFTNGLTANTLNITGFTLLDGTTATTISATTITAGTISASNYLNLPYPNYITTGSSGTLSLKTANGSTNDATGNYALSFGYNTLASGNYSHAEGNNTIASGTSSHAEGSTTIAGGDYSHAEGNQTTANNIGSHSEGVSTIASGQYSHAEGFASIASGDLSHAEGQLTIASNNFSHAEGNETTASASASHAEGNTTIASGVASHAEGSGTTASGTYSHAEGDNTKATGTSSHAEGSYTTAGGRYSYVMGYQSSAIGDLSFVHGSGSTATGLGTMVFGNNIRGTIANTAYFERARFAGSGTTSPILQVSGSVGTLLQVEDKLTADIFNVVDSNSNAIFQVFSGDVVTMGKNTYASYNTTTGTTISSTGFTKIISIPTSYNSILIIDSVFIDYSLKSPNGARAGNVMVIQSGTSVQFTETSTNDIGNTSDVIFSANSDNSYINLYTSAGTTGWTIKTIVRAI